MTLDQKTAQQERIMEAVNRFVERGIAARVAQGLPARVEDRSTLDRVGDLIVPADDRPATHQSAA